MKDLNVKKIERLGLGVLILSGVSLFVREPQLSFLVFMLYVGYRVMGYGIVLGNFNRKKEENGFSSEEEMKKKELQIKEEFFIISDLFTPKKLNIFWVIFIVICIIGTSDIIMRVMLHLKSIIDFYSNLF